MDFISTRSGERVTGAQAVVKGMPDGGGLYVPAFFPVVGGEELSAMLGMDYAERAAFILGKYFDEYGKEELLAALRRALIGFEGDDPAPLVRMDEGLYLLELFHGPTCAYEDIALAAFSHLLDEGRKLLGTDKPVLLLSATNGDTGKAALELFAGREDVKVMVFYPEEGASKMQKLQLGTQEGDNVGVVAVRGSLDDCRSGVKRLFRRSREQLEGMGYLVTSPDSVNIARIVAQTAYYFSAYCDLVTSGQIGLGEKVDFCTAAGSFSNAIAGYYAYRMGLPVGKLLVASNKNRAAADFLSMGTYDAKRPLWRTMSPALDVLIASDAERLVFELSGRDAQRTAERMKALSQGAKSYSLTSPELDAVRALFYAGHTGEDETVECIYDFFEEYGYPLDTHSGVAMYVAGQYAEKREDEGAEKHPVVVLATASPYKFPQDVLYALTGNDVKDSYKGIKRIHLLTAMKVPEALKAIRYKAVRFKTTVPADKMLDEVLSFLG